MAWCMLYMWWRLPTVAKTRFLALSSLDLSCLARLPSPRRQKARKARPLSAGQLRRTAAAATAAEATRRLAASGDGPGRHKTGWAIFAAAEARKWSESAAAASATTAASNAAASDASGGGGCGGVGGGGVGSSDGAKDGGKGASSCLSCFPSAKANGAKKRRPASAGAVRAAALQSWTALGDRGRAPYVTASSSSSSSSSSPCFFVRAGMCFLSIFSLLAQCALINRCGQLHHASPLDFFWFPFT